MGWNPWLTWGQEAAFSLWVCQSCLWSDGCTVISEPQCLPLTVFFNGISALPASQGGVIQYDDTGGSLMKLLSIQMPGIITNFSF